MVSSFFAEGGAKSAAAAMVLSYFSAERVVEQQPTSPRFGPKPKIAFGAHAKQMT